MNTGGLPWASTPTGTALATLLAFGTAGATYMLLRCLASCSARKARIDRVQEMQPALPR